jgi:protein-S-isoprenylcysteine O-methyltransferase Ste14
VAGGVERPLSQRFGGPYGAAQTLLIVAFGAAFFLSQAPSVPPGSVFVRACLIAGYALCASGLALLVASFASLGRAVQVDPEPRAGAHLVTRGVYSRLRHPMYTAIVLLVAGLFLRKPAVAVGAMTACVIAFLALKVRVEERFLAERYPGYAAYRARTWGVFLRPPRG